MTHVVSRIAALAVLALSLFTVSFLGAPRLVAHAARPMRPMCSGTRQVGSTTVIMSGGTTLGYLKGWYNDCNRVTWTSIDNFDSPIIALCGAEYDSYSGAEQRSCSTSSHFDVPGIGPSCNGVVDYWSFNPNNTSQNYGGFIAAPC